MSTRLFVSPLLAASLAAVLVAAAFSTLTAQTVDPDPELFDGTRTKKDQIAQDKEARTDKWTEANLILYDSNEQGSAEGGQGRVGGETPGFADGAQGGPQAQGGIPMPMMGGGGNSDKQATPGMIPVGQESASTPGGPSAEGATPPGGKPGEVGIGDPSQKIAATAQPVNKVGGGVPPPPTGEPTEASKGEATTTVPNSASGQQSGQRGGGVEKGDAMPTDI